MTNIYKHESVEGRPVFSADPVKHERLSASILTQNPLLKQLKPSKNPSRIALVLRRMWASFAKFFSVKHPDIIKENFGSFLRPLDTGALTVSNLFHHYENFLKEDRDCPPGLKKCFHRMEQDEKEIVKLERMEDSAPARDKLVRKTIKSVNRMHPGQSRLFCLQRNFSLDQSASGNLFCTINKNEAGYTINFLGSATMMHELTGGTLPVAGKDKIERSLTFEVDTATFEGSPFLETLINAWASHQGVKSHEILSATSDFAKKEPSSLDDYMTNVNRPDKLFWNIVGSLSQNARPQVRQVRLRAELLTLYEAFDEIRVSLNPKSKRYREFKKLFEDVAGKVLLSYRKGYLSEGDLEAVKKKLLLIDKALIKAEQKPAHNIPSKVSVENPQFEGVSFKKAGIQEPLQRTEIDPGAGLVSSLDQISSLQTAAVALDHPLSISSSPVDVEAAFLAKLDEVHALVPTLQNGTLEEKNWALNEVFRFFSAVPLNDLVLGMWGGELNPDSVWKKFSPDEMRAIMQKIVELTEPIAKIRAVEVMTQYDYEAIAKMRNIVLVLNANRTNRKLSDSAFGLPRANSWEGEKRALVVNPQDQPYRHVESFLRFFPKYMGHPNITVGEAPVFAHIKPGDMLPSIVQLPLEDYDLVFQQEIALMDIFRVDTYDDIRVREIQDRFSWEFWLRPVQNPYLTGLYRKAEVGIKASYDFVSQLESPEGFFDNPEEMFEHFKAKTKEEASLPGSERDLKMLSRLLSYQTHSQEFPAFIKESSSLLYNPEIRNFFDALLFRITRPDLGTGFTRVIASAIEKTMDEIAKELAKPKIEDPELLKNRFHTILYYYETVLRMKGFVPVENLEALCDQCRAIPELNSSFGYASRVLLRHKLSEIPISPDKLGSLLNTFADMKMSYIDPMNVEPQFDQNLQLAWQLIASELDPNSGDQFKPLLDRICILQGLPLDESAWQHEGNLVFRNDQHRIDLKNWEATSPYLPVYSAKLPQGLLEDPFMKVLLAKEDPHHLTVRVEGKIYSFTDAQGIPTQIEEREGKYFLYKQFDSKWLQCLDITSKLEAKEKDTSLLAAYAEFKKRIAFEDSGSTALSFLQNGAIYVDPEKPTKGYVISSKIDFEIKLKKDGKNLRIEKFYDYREIPHTGPFEISSGAAIEDNAFNFLKTFENKNELLLFSKKGRLKKVELPRYNLTFTVKDGKLFSEDGYYINPEADTLGFANALVLEHPDPTKGKKLLLPDADAMKKKIKRVEPKAKGFGKIALFFHYLSLVSDLMKGILPSIVTRKETYFDPNKRHLKCTTINIRPHINEISEPTPNDLLQLMKHAQDPLFFFEKFPLKETLADPKLLKELIQFTDGSFLATGNDSAFKLKVAIKLQTFLESHKRLKKNIQDRLEQNILLNGKQVFQAGRQVTLRLNPDEQMQLNALLKEKDPDFYAKHITTHLAPEGAIDLLAPDSAAADEAIAAWQSTSQIKTPEERIKALEETIQPKVKLTDLSVTIPKLEAPECLLFTPNKLEKLFKSSSHAVAPIQLVRQPEEKPYEAVALDTFQASLNAYNTKESTTTHFTLKKGERRIQKFIDDKLLPKQEAHENTMAKIQEKIEKAFRKDPNAENQVALLSGQKQRATFRELRLALIQGSLKKLQEEGKIPLTYDLNELEDDLISYFDAFAKRNAAAAAIDLLEKMKVQKKPDPKDWQIMSDDLHRLLTINRKYDPKQNPRLLVFEALTAKNFKELPGGLSQLELLENLLYDPRILVQAATGIGKTAVISILEALLKSTGHNLVIQKVLSPLYDQTFLQLKQVLGDLFDTLVMPLRFNLQMSLTKNEIHFEEGEEKVRQTSIFKGMYEDLCTVIKNKGCVLSDYTSFPMMEAKYLQIGQQLVECSAQGIEPTDIQKEHYKYLKKILILSRSIGLQSMDEFDQPNRPIQKLQLDMQSGSKEIPSFFFETTLEIYDHLDQDEALGLAKNMQFDVTEDVRLQARQTAADKMAASLAEKANVSKESLYAYFIGENEDVLEHLNAPPEILDKIAVCKDQFSIYLPLTLNSKEGSRYKRSLDGSKTVPCFKGERHEKAKQGTLFEQMNYLVQDYKQKGITLYDLNTWFTVFKKEWDQAEDKHSLQAEFQAIFPNRTVPEVASLLKNKDPSLVAEVNQDKAKVRQFLEIRLQNLKSSGYLVSLDPVNNVDMTLASSGVSATTGAPESLHDQFKQDKAAVGQVKSEMAYRMVTRASTPNVISYNPEHPEELFTKATKPLHAVIDGAGAFNASTEDGASALLNSNPALKQVVYHDEEGNLVAMGSPGETGVFFNEAHTRGTDLSLIPDAHALLIVNSQEGFRAITQEEGRLRRQGQTYDLAMPEAQAYANLTEVITKAECIDALQDAKDIYRAASQKIRAQARNKMMERLLACKNRKEFVALFQDPDCNSLFITNPEKTYTKPGAYFAANRHIQKENLPPQEALAAVFDTYQKQAERLGIELIQPVYSPELLAKMPPLVSPVTAALECELQVEMEQDVEVDVEMDIELEQNVEIEQDVEEEQSASKAEKFYPPRLSQNKSAAVCDTIHPAYDPRLRVTESFLPFERNQTASQFKRYPFERSMFNVGELYFETDSLGGIVNATVEDPLRDNAFMQLSIKIYDIRLNRKTSEGILDQRDPAFYDLVSQSKFLDGRTSGYSPSELAALEAWLTASNPREMKRHMLEDVLRFRYREKQQFEASQLGELFRRIL